MLKGIVKCQHKTEKPVTSSFVLTVLMVCRVAFCCTLYCLHLHLAVVHFPLHEQTFGPFAFAVCVQSGCLNNSYFIEAVDVSVL